MDDLVEVEIARLVVQETEQLQYVHLATKPEGRSFPIVIGFFEAAELRRKLVGEDGERPMTHDLIGRILEATGQTLKRVVINTLHDNTFFAVLELSHRDEDKLIDCRPSDALALSAQFRCPIFVARQVLDEVAPGE